MNAREIDRRLASILAELYPDASTARTVANAMGLDAGDIDWTGSAWDVWSNAVAWARAHQGAYLRNLIEYAKEDAPGRADLRALSIAERGRTDSSVQMSDMGDMISSHIEGLRRDIADIGQRIDTLGEDVAVLKKNALLYTAGKRTAWLAGFVMFCLPCLLFIEELRVWLDVSVTSATAVILVTWAMAGILFMYGMGLLRNL